MAITPVGVDTYTGSLEETTAFVAFDGQNNRYLAGDFSGTVDFDLGPGVANITSHGDTDFFVAKYADNGSLAWVRNFGGSGSDRATYNSGRTYGNLAVDSSGYVYTTLNITGSVDFDAITLSSSSTQQGTVLLQLDSAGSVQWAQPAISPRFALHEGLTNKSLYVVGGFDGTMQLGSQTLVSSNGDGFVAKLDAVTGQPVSAFQTSGIGALRFDSVAVDNSGSGSVYVTGKLCGVGAIGSNQFSVGNSSDCSNSSRSATDSLLTKFDPSLSVSWAKRVSTNAQTSFPMDVVADNGVVFVRGSFYNFETKIGPSPITVQNNDKAGVGGFLTKVDASGNFLWAKFIGSYQGAGQPSSAGLTMDSAGNVYLGTGHLPVGKRATQTYAEGQYIKRVNAANGDTLNAWKIGPNRNYTNSLGAFTASLAVDAVDRLWASGWYYNTNTFPDGTTLSSVNNTADLFVLRFDAVQLAMTDIAASLDGNRGITQS